MLRTGGAGRAGTTGVRPRAPRGGGSGGPQFEQQQQTGRLHPELAPLVGEHEIVQGVLLRPRPPLRPARMLLLLPLRARRAVRAVLLGKAAARRHAPHHRLDALRGRVLHARHVVLHGRVVAGRHEPRVPERLEVEE